MYYKIIKFKSRNKERMYILLLFSIVLEVLAIQPGKKNKNRLEKKK